jgi:hypothetical protein
MAEGNFGGGGSVIWTIKTDPLKSPGDLSVKQAFDQGVWTESGADRRETAAYGKNFVVRILPPRNISAEEFIKNFSRYAQVRDGRVEFRLVIEEPTAQPSDTYKPQIQVGWGEFPGAQDPFGKTAV